MLESLSIPFFGRKAELEALNKRTSVRGLTVVTGRPQIGKTRLLRQFVDRARAGDQCRIGMAEASEAQGDVLLRAIADAYAQWLARAGALDQLRSLHQQYKGTYVGRVGNAIGTILSEVVGKSCPPIEPIFQGAFQGFKAAHDSLQTGGVHLTPLSSDEARSLLKIIAHAQARPVVLVLNQWEEGRDLDHDVATLSTFLRDLSDWPDTHVLLHLRDPRRPGDKNQDARSRADGFVGLSGAADFFDISPIDFENDLVARESLAMWLTENFPAVSEMEFDEVLQLISGNPAVLERWSELLLRGRNDPDSLRAAARAAHKFHYPEVERCYLDLLDTAESSGRQGALHVALRLALLPSFPSESAWSSVKDAVVECSPDALTFLESHGFLRIVNRCPSLGHPTRHEAARDLILAAGPPVHGSLQARLRPYARDAMETLTFALVNRFTSEQWGTLAEATYTSALVLASMREALDTLEAHDAARSLSLAARTLLVRDAARTVQHGNLIAREDSSPAEAALLAIAVTNAVVSTDSDLTRADLLLDRLRALSSGHPEDPAVREQLASGLNNAIARSGADFARTDVLLDELRALASDHPDDPAVRKQLARGLFNAFHNSEPNSERADSLLDELRALASDHPDDPTVRKQLASGLFNAFNNSEPKSERADSLLDELRALASDHPDDPTVRKQLARGLNNAIAHSGSDFARADVLFNELRALASAHPDDPAIREPLARGLFNAFNNSEPNSERADSLLDELRALASDHPDDPTVRKQLARGLNNAIAHSGSDFARADVLFNELRALASAHPDDPAIREPLARGLFNAFNNSEPNSERADSLLDELRALASDHPDDPAVRKQLARGLFNAFNNSEPNSERAKSLLDELRALGSDHPEDAAVREPLTKGLFNAFHNSEPNSERADSLLDELRALASDHPDDPTVREELASGLSNAIAHTGSDFARADVLLDELSALASEHPDDPAVRKPWAKGLFNAFINSAPNSERSDSLLDELRTLAYDHPDDPAVREKLAIGLFNAFYNSEPKSERADSLLDELRTLASEHPDDPKMHEALLFGVATAMRTHVQSADALAALLREATEIVPRCPQDLLAEPVLKFIRETVHDACTEADDPKRTDIRSAMGALESVWRRKWPSIH